jgi:hypothetical protein
MVTKKNLPIGVSTLEEIINSNLSYIDKTEIIHKLITENRRCFFSRPRRFGKSLLVSTLKEIFSGNKELFKDLWIGQDDRYTWVKRPVVHIDFSELELTTVETLRKSLNIILDCIAQNYQCDLVVTDSPESKLSLLVRYMGVHFPHKAVVLIDEYDAPLLKHITDVPAATAMRDMLSSFYATIKGLDAYIHFTFVAGVTKFAKTSLFSGPNNLLDISLNEKYATLCGYTEQEIVDNFSDYIADCVTANTRTTAAVLDTMRTWYNGYQMSRYLVAKVYNPFSVLLYFENKHLDNYWFGSGTPTFLIKIMQDNIHDFANLDQSQADHELLDVFEISKKIPLKALLFQTGYLTIQSYDQESSLYTLTYPNREVRESINRLALSHSLAVESTDIRSAQVQFITALKNKDMGLFCDTVQSLFAHIPYHIHIQKESFYHALLQMICSLLKVEAYSEMPTDKGRIDMAIHMPDTIYVFEFKLNHTAQEALDQIHKNQYYKKYTAAGKTIYLVGMAFDYETKVITYVTEIVE